MKKVLAFMGSPRKTGNTSLLLNKFMEGASLNSEWTETIQTHEMELKYCTGCLRCNILGRCAQSGDEWESISRKILEADVLVFASPVYFHHVSAPMKKLIDRFRSFIHVQITETGLIHTPSHTWNKDFVLLLSMGSPDNSDAEPVVDLFNYIISILGAKNRLHTIMATRAAVVQQMNKSADELALLYAKMNIPTHLARNDYTKNQKILKSCFTLGKSLSSNNKVE
jgi:multimeric flavodoxin WrbA